MKLRELYTRNGDWNPDTEIMLYIINKNRDEKFIKDELHNILVKYGEHDVYAFGNNYITLIETN